MYSPAPPPSAPWICRTSTILAKAIRTGYGSASPPPFSLGNYHCTLLWFYGYIGIAACAPDIITGMSCHVKIKLLSEGGENAMLQCRVYAMSIYFSFLFPYFSFFQFFIYIHLHRRSDWQFGRAICIFQIENHANGHQSIHCQFGHCRFIC